MNRRRWAGRAALLGAAVSTGAAASGCGAPVQSTNVPFTAAETSTTPVTIEGMPRRESIRRETGKPTEFSMMEESSARRMQVLVAPDVTVPANLDSASYVTVTGTYDAKERKFRATDVATRVPNRDTQAR
jgi:hypothetical protein